MLTIKTGNIFSTESEYIVNTVNCFGVMGAGIALEFKLRYPKMFEKYKEFSDKKEIEIGKLWIYDKEDKNILSFPTKNHWRFPSKIEYIERGLQKFVDNYQAKKISSIAFPLLGVGKGGLQETDVLNLMDLYLEPIDIDIEIWKFKPLQDYEFESFRQFVLNLSDNYKSKSIPKRTINLFKETLEINKHINLSSLKQVKGISENRIQELFQEYKKIKYEPTLFD